VSEREFYRIRLQVISVKYVGGLRSSLLNTTLYR